MDYVEGGRVTERRESRTRPQCKGWPNVPLAEIGKTGRTTDFCEEKNQVFCFGHVKSEMTLRHRHGNFKYADGCNVWS